MVQVNKLKGLFVENGLSYKDVAKTIGISESTMNRRMKDGDFYTDEMEKLVDLFKIPKDTAVEIFFPDSLSEERILAISKSNVEALKQAEAIEKAEAL